MYCYLTDTYQFELKTFITAKREDEKGIYILLDQTLFYPQGGGQPCDEGVIKGNSFSLEVYFVKAIEDEIRHYINADINCTLENETVLCLLDKERRLLNAKYHTAAHLLGNIVGIIYPSLIAIKGHSFPNEAYVEFQGDVLPDQEKLQEELNQAIKSEYKTTVFESNPLLFEKEFYKLPYHIPDHKKFRVVQVGSFPPIPCGGTHLANVSEIKTFNIGKIKSKKGVIKISYEVS